MSSKKEKLRVGFLTSSNPLDKRSSSGVHFRMYQSLSQHFEEVIPLGPGQISKWVTWLLKLTGFIHLRLLRGEFNVFQSWILSKHYAKQFDKKIANLDLDVIYAPKSMTSMVNLKSKLPICFSSDTSFSQISNYYDSHSNFSGLSNRISDYLERKAIHKAKYLIYTSNWALNHVVKDYGANRKDCFLVKHGANIEQVPPLAALKRDYTGTLNFLFIGVNWKRKGGDIAFDAFKILLERGYDITFTVCGCIPPVEHPKMRVIPFLNKNIPAEKKEFEALYFNSHLFFMPTRAECMGLVNCEASAYGLPIISTDTGGVSAAVAHEYNGILLPIEARGAAYAAAIEKLLKEPAQLAQMSINARTKFEKELNWDVWGVQTKEIILKAVGRNSHPDATIKIASISNY